MIHFAPLQTRRLNVQLRELTISQALELAAIPPDRHEAATSAFLARAVASASGPHAEPGRWTVQERMLVVGHYLSAVSEHANFAVGEGRYLDYLDPQHDSAPEWVDVGEVAGDQWACRQVTGDEAVAMEKVSADLMGWICADIAVRMRELKDGSLEEAPDATESPAEFADWLVERKGVISRLPESDFEAMYIACSSGRQMLHHLFNLGFESGAGGHVAIARGEGGADLAPARFPARACLSRVALILGA